MQETSSWIQNFLQKENAQLSLWYFVSFLLGIIFYFKIGNHHSIYGNSGHILYRYGLYAFCVALAISGNACYRYFEGKKLLLTFILLLNASFILGMCVAKKRLLEVNDIALSAITAKIRVDLSGVVSKIKPTTRGLQLILDDVNAQPITRKKKKNSSKAREDPPSTKEDPQLIGNNLHLLHKVKIHINGGKLQGLKVGDCLELRAQLFPPQTSLLSGGYDFGLYLRSSGIQATGYALSVPQYFKCAADMSPQQDPSATSAAGIIHLVGEILSSIDRKIQHLRRSIFNRLISYMGGDNGNFMAAILIGETSGISVKIANDMRSSGVSHILSVSGLHLSLVAMIGYVVARTVLNLLPIIFFRYDVKFIAGILSIILSLGYLLISGVNIAATRAFIMTTLFIMATVFHRSPHSMRSLMVAAFIILLVWPEYALHPSFQLSFSAVLCLISGYELFVSRSAAANISEGKNASERDNRRSNLLHTLKCGLFTNIYSSVLASVFTAPFAIYHFYKFANYSVIMNLIAVPLMSFFIMPLSLLTLLLMPFEIDGPILILLGFCVEIITSLASFITDLPGSIWHVGYINDLNLLVFSLGIFWLFLWNSNWRFLGLIVLAVGIVMMLTTTKPRLIFIPKIAAIALPNNGRLTLYASGKVPKFTQGYLANWYGQKELQVIKGPIMRKNMLFTAQISNRFSAAKSYTVSLNYTSCQEADIQIITSKYLRCPPPEAAAEDAGRLPRKIITYSQIQQQNSLIVY